LKKAHQMSRRLKAGTVWINTYGVMDAALPFGGFKQSGFGRELGMHAVEHYTELKRIMIFWCREHNLRSVAFITVAPSWL